MKIKEVKKAIEEGTNFFNAEQYQKANAVLAKIPKQKGECWEKIEILKAAICIRSGKIEEGLRVIDAVELAIGKKKEETINLRGIILRAQKKLTEAYDVLKAGALEYPRSIDIMHNYSVTAADLGKFDEAIDAGNATIALRPNFMETLKNLGRIYITQRDTVNAKKVFEIIQKVDTKSVDVLVGCGAIALIDQDIPEAISYFERAIKVNDKVGPAWANLGIAYKFLGDFAKAKACLQRAFENEPEQIEHQWNLSLVELATGEMKAGWENYEARYNPRRIATDRVVSPNTVVPMLQPTDSVQGKTVLLMQEQGYGDTFQFYRFAKALKEEGASKIIAITAKELLATVRSIPWIDEVAVELVSPVRLPDYWAFPMSMPYRYKIERLEDIPATMGYIAATKQKVAFWAEKLSALNPKKLRVGLVWAGRETHSNDKNRSMRLEQLAPLAQFQDQIEFISLQKGGREDDDPKAQWPIVRLGSQIEDFSDTAGLLANLDLLISIDSAPVHIAGAMGMPVWTLIPEIFDFRWMVDRTDSPWYPSMRLFRQPKNGGWEPVVQDLVEGLKALLQLRPERWQAQVFEDHERAAKETALAGVDYFIYTGFQYHLDGQYQKAIDLYQRARLVRPNDLAALRNMASAYRSLEQIEQALAVYQYGESQKIVDTIFYANYANLLVQLGLHPQALIQANTALEQDPQNLQAQSIRVNCLEKLGLISEAIAVLDTMLQVQQDAPLLMRKIVLHLQLREISKARAGLNQLFDAHNASIEYELLAAQVLQAEEDYVGALSCYERAQNMNSAHPDLYFNRAVLKAKMLDFEGAIVDTRHCLELAPDNAEAHFHLAAYLLTLGQLSEGWNEYEWRMDARRTAANRVVAPQFKIPLWQGESLENRSILLMPEQGFGDYVQFIRYAQWLKGLGATVLAAGQAGLLPILKTCPWIDRVVVDGEQFKADYWVFAMSLPQRMQSISLGIPQELPYLFSTPEKVDQWKSWLANQGFAKKRPLVALCWQGSASHTQNHSRSIALDLLRAALGSLDCDFVGMNRDGDVLEVYPFGLQVMPNAGPSIADFSDTAAILEQVDLLITIDSAPAHLAGAMNKPCWVLLDSMPDFRWMLGTSTSPWYPSMQLYRKELGGQWNTVLDQVKRDLISRSW